MDAACHQSVITLSGSGFASNWLFILAICTVTGQFQQTAGRDNDRRREHKILLSAVQSGRLLSHG